MRKKSINRQRSKMKRSKMKRSKMKRSKMKRVQKNKSKRKYQKGGVKKPSSKKITVGSSLNPWTLYSGKNPELQYPLKVKEKVEKEKLKKEMKKLIFIFLLISDIFSRLPTN